MNKLRRSKNDIHLRVRAEDGAYELDAVIDDSGDEFEFKRGKDKLVREEGEETGLYPREIWEESTTEMVINQFITQSHKTVGYLEDVPEDFEPTEVAWSPFYDGTKEESEERTK